MTKELTKRAQAFRLVVSTFIEERRAAKGDQLAPEVAAKYEPETWLADAARRVNQIQAVTHVLKASHPDARGTSLHVDVPMLPRRLEVGSHSVAGALLDDVVGNAAALDVFKFLKLEVEGRRLLDWMQQGDADLVCALSDNEVNARAWVAAFTGLIRTGEAPVAHTLAKQVYWLCGTNACDDNGYHLLEPQFASSLAHQVHAEIQEARYGDKNKAARKARREVKPSDDINREYLGLATRKLGGTKPQSISQLNSERGGLNYLLASLPPRWRNSNGLRLMGRKSAIDVFGRQSQVRTLVSELSALLRNNPTNNMAFRQQREAIEQALGAELAAFPEVVAKTHGVGWTGDPICDLPLCEQLWLDQGRASPEIGDHEFEHQYHWGDWPDEVAIRFGNWLNGRLREADLTLVGDAELRHWAGQAVVEAAWPVPMQRSATNAGHQSEANHD